MNEEAQIEELFSIVDKYHIGCGLPKECHSDCGACAAEAIYAAGYRKIKDKPVLLTKHQVEEALNPVLRLVKRFFGTDDKATGRDAIVAQAQWDVWDKWYEQLL